MQYLSDYGTEYELRFVKTKYRNNGNTAIQVMCRNLDENYWDYYCMLTVNLDKRFPENEFYVDSNNCPQSLIFKLENEGKIICTYDFGFSGFCSYLSYVASEEFIKQMEEDEIYLKGIA